MDYAVATVEEHLAGTPAPADGAAAAEKVLD